MTVEFNGTNCFHRIFIYITLFSPKLAHVFVRNKCKIFTTGGTVAPRSSVQVFSDRELQTSSYLTNIIPPFFQVSKTMKFMNLVIYLFLIYYRSICFTIFTRKIWLKQQKRCTCSFIIMLLTVVTNYSKSLNSVKSFNDCIDIQ